MEAALVIALAVAIPVILVPVGFIWYLNVGGMVAAAKRAAKTVEATAKAK